MRAKLGELAAQFSCELTGDPQIEVSTVSTLVDAMPGSISFLANPAYKEQLRRTRASAVVVAECDADDCSTAALIAVDPYLTYARIAALLYPPTTIMPGVHASAVVSPSASVSDSAQIAALAIIGDDAVIESDVFVGPGSIVGERCRIATGCRLIANVTLVQDVRIGRRTIVHPGVVLGADGFGNARSDSGWIKVPQVGGVTIGDDVEIGANTTIDRGTIGDTIIHNGVRLDNLIQIAHNVEVGEHTAIAATVGLSGSSVVGKRCMLAGRAGLVGHVSVCDDVTLGAGAIVTKDIKEAGYYSAAFPAEKDRDWKRKVARFRSLESLHERVKKLEKENKNNDG